MHPYRSPAARPVEEAPRRKIEWAHHPERFVFGLCAVLTVVALCVHPFLASVPAALTLSMGIAWCINKLTCPCYEEPEFERCSGHLGQWKWHLRKFLRIR